MQSPQFPLKYAIDQLKYADSSSRNNAMYLGTVASQVVNATVQSISFETFRHI